MHVLQLSRFLDVVSAPGTVRSRLVVNPRAHRRSISPVVQAAASGSSAGYWDGCFAPSRETEGDLESRTIKPLDDRNCGLYLTRGTWSLECAKEKGDSKSGPRCVYVSLLGAAQCGDVPNIIDHVGANSLEMPRGTEWYQNPQRCSLESILQENKLHKTGEADAFVLCGGFAHLDMCCVRPISHISRVARMPSRSSSSVRRCKSRAYVTLRSLSLKTCQQTR